MPTCQVCRYLVVDKSVEICPNCGATLAKNPNAEDDSEHIESQVDESTDESKSPHESDLQCSNNLGVDDKIELCDPGDFIGAADNFKDSPSVDKQPPGDTLSPRPPRMDDSANDPNCRIDSPYENTDKLKKLSPEKAAEIRSSLLNGNQGDSAAACKDASKMTSNTPSTSEHTPLESTYMRNSSDSQEATVKQLPKKNEENSAVATNQELPELEDVQRTPSVRRIAYFHKNFIQLTGNIFPVSGDDMIIGEHHYLLKPKRIKREFAVAAFSILVALLLFIAGKQFISPTLPGKGTLIGIALDKSGRPLSSGSEISLPETGKKTQTDAHGFFRFNDVGTGSYLIRCSTPDGLVVSENASIIGDQISTISIQLTRNEEAPPARAQTRYSQPPPQPGPAAIRTNKSDNKQSKPREESQTVKKYSSLKLATNVENPKLYADGSPLGVGNLTYQKLMPGNHSVKITKDGYKAWTGTVELRPDKTYTLKVSLEKIVSVPSEPTYSAEDFYDSGLSMLANGNAKAAIPDLTEAINLKPSMADAYANRARAYQLTNNNELAVADYVRAGEIYVQQKRFETAHQMFDNAIDVNDDAIAALINKGDLYRRQKDNNNAENYLKKAAQKDKNNYRANFELGKLYFSMQKHKWANRYLERAKEINPGIPEIYHYLMLNYFARDDFKKVQKIYSDFKTIVSQDHLNDFKHNPRYEPIIRVVGEYERP